ncbi:MAG: hypothetical protein ABL923_05540 [Burkholderiaceae bacterium]
MSISLYDSRPFFEKALQYGVQHGIIPPAKLEAIETEAPKGMVQIARYFGSEYLRPEIEQAKNRIVNLVSLYLEHSTGGNVQLAAESLRDNSFLSHSKAGSTLLKDLITLPQNSHFGMNERTEFTDEHIPLLAKWTLRTLPEFQAELAKRQKVAAIVDAAIWLAEQLGFDEEQLEEAGMDAEAVIRTALLTLAAKNRKLPDWAGFERLVGLLRKKPAADVKKSLVLPKNLPDAFTEVVETVRKSVIADLSKLLDPELPARKLFNQTPAFMGRYFWVEDALSEVDTYEREVDDKHAARIEQSSKTWQKATQGHSDDSSLLTLFLTIAAGSKPISLLTEKSATALIKKIRKSGLDAELPLAYIREHAPVAYQNDFCEMWQEFIADAQSTLKSDFDYQLHDAMALLRLQCNVEQK